MLRPFKHYLSHIRTMGGKAMCNGSPLKVEKISPRTEIELGSLNQ